MRYASICSRDLRVKPTHFLSCVFLWHNSNYDPIQEFINLKFHQIFFVSTWLKDCHISKGIWGWRGDSFWIINEVSWENSQMKKNCFSWFKVFPGGKLIFEKHFKPPWIQMFCCFVNVDNSSLILEPPLLWVDLWQPLITKTATDLQLIVILPQNNGCFEGSIYFYSFCQFRVF